MTVRNVAVERIGHGNDGDPVLVLTAETDADPFGRFDLQYMVMPAASLSAEYLDDEYADDQPLLVLRTRDAIIGCWDYDTVLDQWLTSVIETGGYTAMIKYQPADGEYESMATHSVNLKYYDIDAFEEMHSVLEDKS